jgi:hypothetical protein
MDIKKISNSIDAIESETPIAQQEVRLNFIYEYDDFLILQATQNGLIKFALEVLKFAISGDINTLNNPKYIFSSMSDKKSEFHLIELEKVENIQEAELHPKKEKGSFISNIAIGLLISFFVIALIVGSITIINYLNN